MIARGTVFLAALAGGALAGRLLAPVPAPEVVEVVAEADAPPPLVVREDCPDDGALVERVASLRADLASVELLVKVASAQAEAEIGAALEWPADVPHAFTEEGLEAELGRLLDEAGHGELIGLDCGEYPCVGVVAVAGDTEVFAQAAEIRDAFGGSVYDGKLMKSESLLGAPPHFVMTFEMAFPAAPVEDDGARTRIMFRIDDASETFAADIRSLYDQLVAENP